jgi:hypothetical protein
MRHRSIPTKEWTLRRSRSVERGLKGGKRGRRVCPRSSAETLPERRPQPRWSRPGEDHVWPSSELIALPEDAERVPVKRALYKKRASANPN